MSAAGKSRYREMHARHFLSQFHRHALALLVVIICIFIRKNISKCVSAVRLNYDYAIKAFQITVHTWPNAILHEQRFDELLEKVGVTQSL